MNYKSWKALMLRFGFGANKETYKNLLSAYSQTHRHYHNMFHIAATLKQFVFSAHLADHPDEVELALWFHDVIYNPLSSLNELNSAVAAARFLNKNGYERNGTDRVYSLIMATSHGRNSHDNNETLMADIDLSILGCSEAEFSVFEKNVRKEYRWIPNAIYRKKRKELLRNFLERDRIYNHDYFYDKFEHKAKMNLKKAVSIL